MIIKKTMERKVEAGSMNSGFILLVKILIAFNNKFSF